MSRSRSRPYENVVIRASAGTGKTFALSNRFIGLVVDGAPVDAILASTFTRKAAGEILDRVLFRLAEAALDRGACHKLAGFIAPVKIDTRICLSTLKRMVSQLHRLRISTLDSFFIQVAESFSLELGLPPGWQIMDEFTAEQLSSEAVRIMLQKADAGEVTRLMHLIHRTEASRSVSRSIKDVVGELLTPFMEAPLEAWESLPTMPLLSKAKQAAGLDVLAQLQMQGKRFDTARGADIQRFREHDWEGFLSKGLAKSVFRKQTFYKKEPPDEVKAVYKPLVRHAIAVLINRIADQTRATGELIKKYDHVLQALKQQRRMLRFPDVTRMLLDRWPARAMRDVDYRLDARSAHLLLDEFQDTSPLQWQVIRPFAEKSVEDGRNRSFFCVGDVKQAIYGWRGGVAEIFDVLGEKLPGLRAEAMDKSFRSSPAVIEAVNRTFEKIDENPALSKYKKAAKHWADRFSTHTTEHDKMPGWFCVESSAEGADDEKKEDACLAWAAARAAELLEKAPGLGIGILVRRNKSVGQMIRLLRYRHQIRASEEGGNPLSDSPAVELVLSLLRLADHPGDGPARFHVAHSPLADEVGFFDHADEQAAWRLSREVRRSLVEEGYGAVIQRWTQALAGTLDRRDVSRLIQLTEMAFAYEAGATPRTADFDGYVRSQRVENPTADRVRVMTVHKSKGLQFDIVILPELHASMMPQTPMLVSGRPGPSETIDRLCRYVSKEYWPALPEPFQKVFEDYENQQIVEALCLLYVAMTRAIHALYMIIPPTTAKGRTSSSSYEALLRNLFCNDGQAPPETVLAGIGDAHWFDKLPAGKPADKMGQPAPEATAPVRLAKAKGKRPCNMERVSPSQMARGTETTLSDIMHLSDQEALKRGTLIHAWFELIEWLDEAEPTDTELMEVASAVFSSPAEAKGRISEFRKMLAIPAMRGLLSKSAYSANHEPDSRCKVHTRKGISKPHWEVFRERAFVIRDGDTLVNGTMDRLVVLHDHDLPVGADLIDYKTDRLDPNDKGAIRKRVAHYSPQLRAYRLAVQQLFGLEAIKVSTRLVFVESGITEYVN